MPPSALLQCKSHCTCPTGRAHNNGPGEVGANPVGGLSSRQPRQGAFCVGASKSSLAALTLGAIGVVYGDIGTSPVRRQGSFGSGHVPSPTPTSTASCRSFLDPHRHRLDQVRGAGAARGQQRRGGLIAMLALASQAVRTSPSCALALLASAFSAPRCSMATVSSRQPSRCCRRSKGWRCFAQLQRALGDPADAGGAVCLFAVQNAAPAASASSSARSRWCGLPRSRCWACAASSAPRDPGAQPHHAWASWFQPLRPSSSWGRGAVRDGGAGAVRRHGPFRQAPDPPGLVRSVMPALTLNYFGQGALLLAETRGRQEPFFLMAPTGRWCRWWCWPPWRPP